jgi:hypothetical protein
MLNKIEVMDAIQGLSRTQVDILKALADRIQQREAEAKRMNLDTISYSYRLTMEDQHNILPELETDEDVIEKMWWALNSLRYSAIHRLKGNSVHCDVWILKFSRNIYDNSLYILIDKDRIEEYRALAA